MCSLLEIAWLIALARATEAQSQFNPFPLNQAVLSGVNANFTCGSTSSSSFAWYNSTCYPVPTTCPASDIHVDGNPGRYTVTTSTVGGTIISRLTVIQSQSTDAGIFVCQQPVSASVTLVGIAQLIVIEQMSTCTSNVTSGLVENDTVALSCSVMFSGIYAPVMQFKDGNSIVTNGVTNITTANQSATYKLQFTASRSLDGKTYSCRTYFDQPTSVSSAHASNIPYYDQTTDCPALPNVMYPVDSIAISPIQSQYDPGESISCQAVGKPAPSYTWTNINNTADQPGVDVPPSTLSITWAMAGTIQTYTCTASNTVAGKMFSISQTITFYVTTVRLSSTTTTQNATLLSTVASNISNGSLKDAVIALGVCLALSLAANVALLVIVIGIRRQSQAITKASTKNDSQSTNHQASNDQYQELESIPYSQAAVYTTLNKQNIRDTSKLDYVDVVSN